MSAAHIRKATSIRGKALVLRNVVVSDAAFILSLRTNPQKSKYLSQISGDLDAQIAWLVAYGARDEEAYFIIQDFHGIPLGAVRIYDAVGSSFCWGSWILLDSAPSYAAIESALMVYTYALDSLKFESAHFQVHRANENVWMFHERFGAERTAENEVQYDYRLSNTAIKSSIDRYRRYLPHGIFVESLLK